MKLFASSGWLRSKPAHRRAIRGSRRALPRPRALRFESLEERRLLATFSYSATNADPLTLAVVAGNLEVIDSFNSTLLKSAPLSFYSAANITGYSGGGQQLTVSFGGGDFNIPITFNSQASLNKLMVDDLDDSSGGVNYSISSSAVQVASTTINYNSTLSGGLTLDTGFGQSDQVVVSSTQVPTLIDTSLISPGTKIFVGGTTTTGKLANLAGPLTLDSHSADILSFLDNGSSNQAQYDLTSTGLEFDGQNLAYGSAASITLATSSFGGESVFITSLPATTTYLGLAPTGTRTSMIISPSVVDASQGLTVDASSMVPAGKGDLLTVDDSTDGLDNIQYRITSSTVQSLNENYMPAIVNTLVEYSPNITGGLVVNTGSGDGDGVAVASTAATVPVAINTSGAYPTSLEIGEPIGSTAGNLTNIAGPLTLQTHAGDAIVFNDSGNTAAANYQFNGNYLVYNSSIIGYGNARSIAVQTSLHSGDQVTVSSLPGATSFVNFVPGGTNQSLLVSPAAASMAGLTVDAFDSVAPGSNAFVTLDDSTDANSSVTYQFKSLGSELINNTREAYGSVAVVGGATVVYGQNDTGGLVLNTGTGSGDAVDVDGTLKQVQVAINTSGVNGTAIFVGGDASLNGSLSSIAGPLTLKTTAIDSIVFLDNMTNGAVQYELTSNELVFGNRIIGYTSAVAIELSTSPYADAVNIASLPAPLQSFGLIVNNSSVEQGTSITVGAGAMTSSLQRTIDVGSFIPAGANDTLTVDDSTDAAPSMLYNLVTRAIFISPSSSSNYTAVLYSPNYKSVTLLTGTGANDTVDVAVTSAAMIIATAAMGDASILVGSGGTLSNIASGLHIQANSPNDQLTFNDSDDTVNQYYSVQGSSLQVGSSLLITFSIKTYTVLVGTGVNDVVVEEIPADETVDLTINPTDTYTQLGTVLGTVNLTYR